MTIETTGSAAMSYLDTRPLIFITTKHADGVVNAGVFGAYTGLSGEIIRG